MTPRHSAFVHAALLTVALGHGPAAAQSRPTTPEHAARGLVERMREADWDGLTARMHPDALKEMRSVLEPLAVLPDEAQFRRQFLGVETAEEVTRLSDAAVFSAMIRSFLTRDPDLVPALKSAELTVLGHVMEGPTAHVVSRMRLTAEGISVAKMEVSSFRQLNGEWLGLLSSDLSQLAAALREAGERRANAK